MSREKTTAGSTSKSIPIFVQSTASTTGGGLAGLTHSTSGLIAEYRRRGQSTWTSITLVSKTLGTYTSGGFVADGSLDGAYEFDPPDAAFAAGSEWVAIRLRGAANMFPVLLIFELDAVNYQDSTRFGLSALPNVAQGNSGALPTGNASGQVTLAGVTHTGAVIPTVTNVTNRVTANTDQWGGEAVTGMPMPTYTQPTGFLAATFPATVASPTNITSATGIVLAATTHTGAVIPTVTNLTNGVTVTDKTGFSLASDGLSQITAWTVNITGNLSGSVGSVTGSVGSISGVTFPASFGSWTAPLNASGTASAVWDALIASYTVANSFGSRVLRTDHASAGNAAKVTSAGHVAADIHELQPDAVTEIQSGLALEASSQTILARIGAFTGSGVNTILGFFRALLRSDAGITTPSDVGGTFTHTTDSTQAIRDRGDAAWITGAGGGGGGSGAGTYPSLQVPPYPLAAYMTSDLFTYADIVQRLRDKRGLEGSARQMHALKVAVQDALTELAGRSTWRHYNRRVAVTTKAVVQKTASFDTATDILSIATGAWPTDAQYGEIVFDNQRYKVASRISDTELLLSSLTAPQASFTNKAVTWMQASYALPVMFRQIRSVIDEDAYRPLEYMSPADAVRHRKLARTTGQTLRYTLRSSENYMGLKEIEFSPVPAKATRFEVALIVRPRPFKTYELTGTDGAYTTGTQTFTSATAAFSATHVGCILRISATATLPKGPTVFDESRVDFAVQAFITEVVSATEVKVSLPFTATASGKGYTVSDPADIDPTSMLAALDALAWEKYCLNIDMPAEALSAARVLAKEEFDRGIAADSADTNQPESAINYDVDTFDGFEPNVDVMGGQ